MNQNLLTTGGALALSLLCVQSTSAQQLKSTEVAAGLASPIGVTSPPGDTRRLFVLERAGRIRIVRNGVLLAAPFLDITPEVLLTGEAGLLGLAFHPDYAHNGRFFVSFVTSHANSPELREYHVSADPNIADAASASVLFGDYGWQSYVHYSSDLHFGPDGMLYYTLGHGTPGNPQALDDYQGKVLRIDVDRPPSFVPLDNPFADPGDGALDWTWAIGLRNPWRFSFDRLNGDLYIGDVGAQTREELNHQPASFGLPGDARYQGGRNYGWYCMEGTACTGDTVCDCDTSGATLTLPIYETTHGGGPSAIIGGYVYRGSRIAGQQGRYFFTDHFGHIMSLRVVDGQATDVRDESAELTAGLGQTIAFISSFGQDASGELYVTSLFSGKVFRIDAFGASCPAPSAYCTSAPNSAGFGAQIAATGATTISAPELTLVAAHAPTQVAGLFIYGTTEVSVPLGNGTRCVGGNLLRLPVVLTDEHGFAQQPFDASSMPLGAGDVRDFQFYYRDLAAGGANFNLSDALRVTFCP